MLSECIPDSRTFSVLFQEIPVWRSNGSTSDATVAQALQDSIENSSTPDFQRTKAAIDQTYQKIARTKELIKEGQTVRDGKSVMLFEKM